MNALIEIIYLGGVYDQLNLPSLASMEYACRRIQVIVDAYATPGKAPNWEMARYLSGQADGVNAVSRELRGWAVKHAKEDADIQTARSRARGTLPTAEEVEDAQAEGALPDPGRGQGGRRGARGHRARPAPGWQMSVDGGGEFWPDPAAGVTGPGGASAPPSKGTRQLFPLPWPDPAVCPRRLLGQVREAVSSLNFLAGFTREDVPSWELAGDIHREVHARVEGLVRRARGARAETPSPQECYRELLRGRAGYDFDAAGVTLAPFHKDRVSLPEDLTHSPFVADLLDAADRSLLEVAAEPLLRPAHEVEELLRHAPRAPTRTLPSAGDDVPTPSSPSGWAGSA